MLYNKEQIKSILPHREHMLLVDEVETIIDQRIIVGIKHVLLDDFYFKGHFDKEPIMPGVMMVEACAQTGALLVLSLDPFKGKMCYFAGIDKVRFKQRVKPNQILKMKVELLNVRHNIGRSKIEAFVDEKQVLIGEILFTIGEPV